MPTQKDFKRVVRSRMEKTGESYTAARLQVLKKKEPAGGFAKTAGMSDAQKKEQDAREKVRMQKHNAAVADEEAVADRFNTQLHAYNDKLKKQ